VSSNLIARSRLNNHRHPRHTVRTARTRFDRVPVVIISGMAPSDWFLVVTIATYIQPGHALRARPGARV
ncbi:MAG: hypothetical protein AAFU81_00565, partial [Pseudomonadota bacterium]